MSAHHDHMFEPSQGPLLRSPFVDEDTFWAMIAQCREESGNNTELAARILFRRLRALGSTEVVEFVQLWEQARSRLYSWLVTDAACLMLGPVEEEDLRHIQNWIISHGRPTLQRVVGDPDSLTDLATDGGNARAQWFDEFITEAHVLVSGTWPSGHDPDGPENLIGERTDLDDPAAVRQWFPRLAAFRRDNPGFGKPEVR